MEEAEEHRKEGQAQSLWALIHQPPQLPLGKPPILPGEDQNEPLAPGLCPTSWTTTTSQFFPRLWPQPNVQRPGSSLLTPRLQGTGPRAK